jgi:hypothetical protein
MLELRLCEEPRKPVRREIRQFHRKPCPHPHFPATVHLLPVNSTELKPDIPAP